MNAPQFQNALRVMFSLDEIIDVLPRDKVAAFHADPLGQSIRMDAETWAKVFGLIEARTGTPPHVAEATAAAFNRAMQAVPDGPGAFTYTTKRQVWNITDERAGIDWRAKSDGMTVYWQYASGLSPIEVMDKIDAIEEEHGCDGCAAVPGSTFLEEVDDGQNLVFLCTDCQAAEYVRQQELHEAAGDDKAHAHADLIHADNEGRN